MADIIDSYTATPDDECFLYSGQTVKEAQSFTCSTTSILETCVWKLSKVGSPTGNVVAKLYSHTGTFGTSSFPDALLATSGTLDISTLTTDPTDKTFTFSGAEKCILQANTYYVLVIEYSGGDASNKLRIAQKSTDDAHSGNDAYYISSWAANEYADNYFIVYGTNDETIIDGYNETNQTRSEGLYAGNVVGFGQAFACTVADKLLDSVKFYAVRTGTVGGSVYAKLYAINGTFGTDGKPNGAALATSDAVAGSSIGTSAELVTFSFSGANRVELENGTKYAITIENTGADGSNCISVYMDGTSPSHSGNCNYTTNGATWTGMNTYDTCFYVYGADPAAASTTSTSELLNYYA